MASTAMTAMRVEVSDDSADRRREQPAGPEGQRPGTDRGRRDHRPLRDGRRVPDVGGGRHQGGDRQRTQGVHSARAAQGGGRGAASALQQVTHPGRPEVEAEDGISEECDRALRSYYGIGAADQELWSDNKGYATLVSDEAGAARRVENVDEAETPDADKRTDETISRVKDPGPPEMRQITADEVAAETSDPDKRTSGGVDDDTEGG